MCVTSGCFARLLGGKSSFWRQIVKTLLFALALSATSAFAQAPTYFVQIQDMQSLAAMGLPVPTGTPDQILVLMSSSNPRAVAFCATVTYQDGEDVGTQMACSPKAHSGWTMVAFKAGTANSVQVQHVSVQAMAPVEAISSEAPPIRR